MPLAGLTPEPRLQTRHPAALKAAGNALLSVFGCSQPVASEARARAGARRRSNSKRLAERGAVTRERSMAETAVPTFVILFLGVGWTTVL